MEYEKRRGFRGPADRLTEQEDMDEFIAKSDAELNGEQLKPEKVYEGLVTGVDIREQYFTVAVGKYMAQLTFEDAEWAKLYNPTDNPDEGKHHELTQIIKKGDIIKVAVKSIPEDNKEPIQVTLEQEPLVNASLIAIEPGTGYVKAMVGGADFAKSQFNRAVQAKRQPGSAFKPIIYAAALDKGYTPASVIVDSPIIFEEALKGAEKKGDNPDTGTDWKPRNFDEKFHGPTTFRQALTYSRNVVTIKILKDIGVNYAVEYARKLGVQSQLNNDLSLALGSSSISLLELTNAYAVFANMGTRIEPVFITKITDKAGNILEETSTTIETVLTPQTAYIMTNLLAGVIQDGTGQRAKALGRPAAGKTGTTNDLNDAWFIGFTPNLIAGSWMGYDDERPLGHMETGARAALPIWLKFMQKALEGTYVKDFQVPEGVVFTRIDHATGMPATPATEKAIFEAFKEGTAPIEDVNLPSVERTAAPEKFFEMDTGTGNMATEEKQPADDSAHEEMD